MCCNQNFEMVKMKMNCKFQYIIVWMLVHNSIQWNQLQVMIGYVLFKNLKIKLMNFE